MPKRDAKPATPNQDPRANSGKSWLITEALRKLPSLKYALGIAAIMALLALGKASFASPSEALAAAGVMIALMIILVIFNWISKSGPGTLHIPAVVLTWAMVMLFVASAAATVGSVFFDKPKSFPALIEELKGKSAPTPNPLKPVPALTSVDRQSLVPVTIKAVYGANLFGASHTIITIRNAEKGMIVAERIPDSAGEVHLSLRPDKYVLNAIGGGQPLAFEVLPPGTEITVLIHRMTPDPYGPSTSAVLTETVSLNQGTSAEAMDRQIFISVVTINFSGAPPRNRVTFTVSGDGRPAKTLEMQDVGAICSVGQYEVKLRSADANTALFIVTKRQ